MKQVYPKHIYEPIRIKIATDYIKRELRKYLANVRGTNIWGKIDKDIDTWFDKSPNIGGARDFWNGFHGIAMGFKLKVGFIQVLTAQNVSWKLEKKLQLNEALKTGSLEYISLKLKAKRLSAKELTEFFKENQKLVKKWKQEFAKHGKTSDERDNFPIIAMEEKEGDNKYLSVHDGNRRTVLAILNGKKTILAYVGRYKTADKTPKNFWLPTSFLMELVREGQLINDYQGTLAMLKKLIKLSKSGEYELKERILIGQNEFRMKLKKGLEC